LIIDTKRFYQNEAVIVSTFKSSFHKYKIKREDLFITTPKLLKTDSGSKNELN
jgi:diketogulonate reductase-like aldo/keto reductase